jgi:Tol biopolymer transport system component
LLIDRKAMTVVLCLVCLVPPRLVGNDDFPAWSPDGKKIVFMSDRDGDIEIYVVNADGTHLKRLTHAPGRDAHPAFSRDGRKIAFRRPAETCSRRST